MAEVKAFCALRPNEKQAAEVAALPYDVYSREEARAAVQGHPLSFLNIDRPETQFPEDCDMYAQEVYEKARDMLREQTAAGVYVREEKPVYFFYELSVESGVLAPLLQGHSQTGVVACSSVDDYLNQVVRKHENTREEKERDRIRHVDIVDAQTGPIFLTYRGTEALKACEARAKKQAPLYDFVSEDGIRHRVWRVADEAEVAAVTEGFRAVPTTYIADGHHRAASAVKVALKRREEHPDYTGKEEFNYFLSVLFPEEELRILPYNRVVDDLNGESPADLLLALDQVFTIRDCGETVPTPEQRGELGMYLDGHWYALGVREELRSEDPVEGLDVSFLQDLVLAPLLGIDDPRTSERIRFIGGIRGSEELKRLVDQKGGVAFLMYPTQMEELLSVADAGLLMPPKSTWFEPKLRSGLFIHSL